ncbi:alpha-2-macroglobulin [Utexia brackfieldae]|uniref:alpha-2-macroglobulin family protein n=1 Tax=Utexia brackfieldae TaxID=3074108 RepID=UPI00370D313B
MRFNLLSQCKYWRTAVVFLFFVIGYFIMLPSVNATQTESNAGQSTLSATQQSDDEEPIESQFTTETLNHVNANPSHVATPIDKNQFRDKSLTVLDASEMIIDGASTMVVTFSIPIDPHQHFSQLLRLVDKEKGLVDGEWELSDNQRELHLRYLEPGRSLIVNIDQNLKSINNVALAKPYQNEITTRSRSPVVGFTGNGSLLPANNITGLPIMAFNVNRVDVNFYKIKPAYLYKFLKYYRDLKQVSVWDAEEIMSYVDLVYSGRFDLNLKSNVQENLLLNLSSITPLQQEGFYLAIMNKAGNYAYNNPATTFSISDIGVSVHVYPNKSLSLLTQSLSTGAPLSDVDIELVYKNGDIDVVGKTDKNGFLSLANLTLAEDPPLLIAHKNQQNSLIELERNALDLSEFNITGNRYYDKQLFTFGPRDLYRPGEKVFMNALLRDADGKPLQSQPVKVEVLKPDGQVAFESVWLPADNQPGFYQMEYAVPLNASVGKWTFRFNVGDDNYRYHDFMVEEFLPERMGLELTSQLPTQAIDNQQDVSFHVKGWYLYGAPANGNKLQGQIYLKTQRKIAGLNDFEIGLVDEAKLSRYLSEVDTTLDESGETEVSASNSNWRYIKSPVQIMYQASLLDAGGRPINRQVSQTVWPADKMPAVRALFGSDEYYDWSVDRYVTRPTVDEGSMAQFEVISVDSQGQRQLNPDMQARIIKERRDYYWTWSANDGWHMNYNQKEFVVSDEQLNFDSSGIAQVNFVPDDWGSYRLEVTDNQTHITTSSRFWSGYSWADNTNGTGSVRPDQVKLSLDKLAYNPGDKARVHVQAPNAGKGYIAVESNSGILWSKMIEVPEEGIDIDIPIANWQRHDLYISSAIIRSTDLTNQKNQTIKRAVGLLYLPFNVDDRQLSLKIDAPAKVEPNQTVPVKIKLSAAQQVAGKSVTVLVSAVDSGVLNITNFVTPDPFSGFLGRKRYEVDQFDVYGKLIEGKGRAVGLSFGGDSDAASLTAGGKRNESTVQIIAQQLQTVTLDDNGEATVELTLPDFNGELRLMAQAWDETRFGKAEQTMKVAAPIIAELSAPRFLSGGDKATLAIDLRNLTDKPQSLILSFSAEGLLSLDKQMARSQSVELAAGQRTILPVLINANAGFGSGRVNMTVDGIKIDGVSGNKMRRAWSIAVRPAYAADTLSYSFVLDKGDLWQIPKQALSSLIPNTVEGKLAISNKPVINVAQYIKALFAYPYGCLEQTSSGLYPSLFSNHAELKSLGIESDTDDVRRDKIEQGIEHILGMQRSNGSFGLWSKESPEEYWLTVYATDFLLQAQQRGYPVNSKALDKAIERINAYIYDSSAFYNMSESNFYNGDLLDVKNRADSLQFMVKSYAVMVLTQHGKITPVVRNEINRLYLSARDNGKQLIKSSLSLVHLAIAAKNAGYVKAMDNLLDMAFEYHSTLQRKTEWYGDFGSQLRDDGMMLFLLLDNDLKTDKAYDLLPELASSLNAKHYLSTQELNAVFLAGWQINQQKVTDNWQVELNGVQSSATKPFTLALDDDDLNAGLMIQNPAKQHKLYGRIDITGYAQQAPAATSDNQVLRIERTYYDIDGNKINPESLSSGDLVVVILDVYADRELADALVVDLLPAGLELENQHLENSSVSLSAMPNIASLLKDENSADIQYQEYRDDRYVAAVNVRQYYRRSLYRTRVAYLARAVTPGWYHVPASYVESMYNPSWFAIGETSANGMTIKASQ